MSRHRRRTTAALATTILAALALAACSGGGGGASADSAAGSSARGAAGSSAKAGAPGTTASRGAGGQGSGATGAPVSPAALEAARQSQQLARQASLALEVTSIGQAVARVRSAAIAGQGIVLAENIGPVGGIPPLPQATPASATTYAEITISVPSAKLDAVMADLGSVGKVLRSSTSSVDVGSQIVDTQSRLQTMRVSVERVRAFLSEAKAIDQVVALEAELTRRESDLESLEAQLASLKDSVAMSPVQVSLTTRPSPAAQPQSHDAGFLGGLRSGWHAFTASATVLLTVLGALVPFLVLVALVGVPLLVWLRRRRATGPRAAVAQP